MSKSTYSWTDYLPYEAQGIGNGQAFIVSQNHSATIIQNRIQQLHLVSITLQET